jgi:hypothetical protein
MNVMLSGLEALLAEAEMADRAAKVLQAAWQAEGRAITSNDLFDAMYDDDPAGGPSQTKCYVDLRGAVTDLDAALSGSGVSVVYRSGGRARWRLRIKAGIRDGDLASTGNRTMGGGVCRKFAYPLKGIISLHFLW